MKTSEVLRKAKALIDTPEKWIKGVFSDHLCFCAMGAVYEIERRAGWPSGAFMLRDPELALMKELPDDFPSVELFNDDIATTHDDIMSLYDRATAAAEKAES